MNAPAPLRSPAPKPARIPARERLLDAAAVVFARDGLAASTTREISRAAGVNEVTLFRLFKTKQNLLTAVLERIFAPGIAEAIRSEGPVTDLAEIVREYVVTYAAGIQKNVTLRRVLIGEIQHFKEPELKVIRGIFEPSRQHLIRRLRAAQEAGLARREMDPAIVADQISAMIFMGALKSSLPLCREYDAREYIDACVEMVVRAVGTSSMAAPGKRRDR
jgi:AcrR family transcriptional regulator